MMHTHYAASGRGAGTLAIFQLGFRPFFLSAALFSVVAMGIWMAVFVFSAGVLPAGIPPAFWHAHEMVYGYALAVVAGFLLTAIRNWSGIQTIQGRPLLLLLFVWVLARIASFVPGSQALLATMMLDSMFIVFLSVALTVPIVRARLWNNMGLVSKVYFMLAGHVIYVLGLLDKFEDGQRIGVYIGVYMIISLILVLARRVMPMFIERGVGYPVSLKNRIWVDVSCFLLFLVFAISDIFFSLPTLTASAAAGLCVLHGIRLWGWHTHGIWQRPLLWVLFVAYGWIVVGFGLKFAAFVTGIAPSLATHAFTAGGIGMMTLGMMSRVSLGHTGRNVLQPPRGVGLMFSTLALAVLIRVVFPLVFVGNYATWIAISQILWMAAFSQFLFHYARMLMQPRIDGRPG